MTSIADPRREPATLVWTRVALLTVLLCLGLLSFPPRWALLWLAVPAVVATGLLLAWRFGRGGLVFPAVLAVAVAIARIMLGGESFPIWLGGWVPLAALTGAWMGLHEEGGGPSIGDRLWMLVPLLALAAALPLLPGFTAAIARLETLWMAEQARVVREMTDAPVWWKDGMKQQMEAPIEVRRRLLLTMIPTLLFLWMSVLVSAGRSFAARFATLLGWPSLSRASLTSWRLPDPALVPLLVGLALLLLAGPVLHTTGTILLVAAALGYSLQGLAVVGGLLSSRGMPPALVALTLLFVLVVSLLWILPALAVLGLSDVWLDHRRLEPSSQEEA